MPTDIEEWTEAQAAMGRVTVRFTPRYLTFLEAVRDLPSSKDAWGCDINLWKSLELENPATQELEVLCADRWGKWGTYERALLVWMPERKGYINLRAPRDVEFVQGGPRKVYRPGGFHPGGTGTAYGAILKGISTGRTFRGR